MTHGIRDSLADGTVLTPRRFGSRRCLKELRQIRDQDGAGSSVEFLEHLFIVHGFDDFPQSQGEITESRLEDIDDALPKALLSAFLSAEAFEGGNVGVLVDGD